MKKSLGKLRGSGCPCGKMKDSLTGAIFLNVFCQYCSLAFSYMLRSRVDAGNISAFAFSCTQSLGDKLK